MYAPFVNLPVCLHFKIDILDPAFSDGRIKAIPLSLSDRFIYRYRYINSIDVPPCQCCRDNCIFLFLAQIRFSFKSTMLQIAYLLVFTSLFTLLLNLLMISQAQ